MDDPESPFRSGETVTIDVDAPGGGRVQARIARQLGRGGQAWVYRINQVKDYRNDIAEPLPSNGLILRLEKDEPRNGDYSKLSKRNQLIVELGNEHEPAADGLVRVRLAGWTTWRGSRNSMTRFAQLLDDGGLALDVQQRLESLSKGPQPYRSEYTDDAWGAIFAPAARAVAFLHGRAIIHRDINPRNFLAAHPNRLGRLGLDNPAAARILRRGMPFVRLSDFGTLVRGVVRDGESKPSFLTSTRWRTTAYTPPEIIRSEDPRQEADAWMFACSMVVLMTGRLPFAGFPEERHDYEGRILDGAFDSDVMNLLDGRWRSLLTHALAPDWSERATMSEIADECSSISLYAVPDRSRRSVEGRTGVPTAESAITNLRSFRQPRKFPPGATQATPDHHLSVEQPTDGWAEDPPELTDEVLLGANEIDNEVLRRALVALEYLPKKDTIPSDKEGEDDRPSLQIADLPDHFSDAEKFEIVLQHRIAELRTHAAPPRVQASPRRREDFPDRLNFIKGLGLDKTGRSGSSNIPERRKADPSTRKYQAEDDSRKAEVEPHDTLRLDLAPVRALRHHSSSAPEQDAVPTEKVHTTETEPNPTLPLPASSKRARRGRDQ